MHHTYWLSLVDKMKPQGQAFVGVIVVDASSETAALEAVQAANIMPRKLLHVMPYRLEPAERQDDDFRESLSRTPRMVVLDRARLDALGFEPD